MFRLILPASALALSLAGCGGERGNFDVTVERLADVATVTATNGADSLRIVQGPGGLRFFAGAQELFSREDVDTRADAAELHAAARAVLAHLGVSSEPGVVRQAIGGENPPGGSVYTRSMNRDGSGLHVHHRVFQLIPQLAQIAGGTECVFTIMCSGFDTKIVYEELPSVVCDLSDAPGTSNAICHSDVSHKVF